MIRFERVTRIFGETTAVENLTFDIQEGASFGLIGTSGCGKTTTLRMINRLIEPTEGTIFVDGTKTTARNPRQLRRQMGYVIQNVGLFPHYTVQENVGTVPQLLDWKSEQIESRTRELLERVGLDPHTFSDRYPASLSGGQQQRVGLARALAADPPILLMDEPFGALDPITKQQVRREFQELLSQMDKTIVLVTHDIFEAFEMCERLCLLDDGSIQQIGTPRELLFYPSNEFVESFFASNRFQLELLSVTLRDLLAVNHPPSSIRNALWIYPSRETKEGDFIRLSTSLYTLLDEMEKRSGAAAVKIVLEETNNGFTLDFTALMDLFQQFKKTIKNEEGGSQRK